MKILVAGDFCPQNRVAEAFEHDDFELVLSEVRSLTAEADYSIVNLECPVTKGGEKPISKVGPNLQCSEKGMAAIKWGGFDCVALANNHFYDYGDEGVKHTLEACGKYGIDSVGGGRNLNEASKILYKYINGQTLAIINCCEHEFSIATDKTGGSNPLNPIQQYYAIREARTQADFVLVIVHGGNEHYQLPSPRMKETYRFFVDAGADAVVNHHQHCYSGYEYYNEKLIFYGLGNFCFDKNNHNLELWNQGFTVLLDFSNNNCCPQLIPYYQCFQNAKICRLDKESMVLFNEKMKELNSIIDNNCNLTLNYESFIKTSNSMIREVLEPYQGRFFSSLLRRKLIPTFINRKKKQLILSFIQCESHIPKVVCFLKNKE